MFKVEYVHGFGLKLIDVINKFWKLQITNGQKAFSLSLSLPDIMNLVLSKEIRSTQSPEQCGDQAAYRKNGGCAVYFR